MPYHAGVTATPLDGSPPHGIELHHDVPLARYTYLRVGGPARLLAIPDELSDLERLLAWARSEGARVRVLGGGSNLLVADAGVDALVISLRRAAGGLRFEGTQAIAGAAVMLPALSRAAAERGLGGSSSRSASPAPSAAPSTATPASATAAASARSSSRWRCSAAAAAR